MSIKEREELILREKADVILKVAQIEKAKKELEAQEKSMREQLLAAMEEYGVTLIDNETLSVQYMPGTTRESFDAARFRKDYPETAGQYVKKTDVKASIRIKVK